jgi:riboflavin synthase alpha subunit
LKIGDSLAVNGCCLTVVEAAPPVLVFQVVPESLARTVLGKLKPGSSVNLEPPLTLADPLGGHFVQGHVDGTAEILEMKPEGDGARLRVRIPESLAPYVIEKGSIALDGVSLTVAAVSGVQVEVALIPHTLENTGLKSKSKGDLLQVEADMMAKYVEKLSSVYAGRGKA